MDSEVKTEENGEENKEPQTPEYTEVELQALEHGWKPKEEFETSEKSAGKKWRDAEDFMDRKSLFDKIDAQHRRSRELEKGVAAAMEHNKKIEQSAYERALRELKAERKAALEEGDAVKAEEVRDRIDEVKEKQKQVEKTAPINETAARDIEIFVQRNKWYTTDVDMKAWAEGYADSLYRSGVTNTAEAFPMIEEKVKQVFPHKFRNPNKDRAPNLEGGQRKTSSDSFQLSQDEERAMNHMIRAGAPITREEYIKQLKKSRGS